MILFDSVQDKYHKCGLDNLYISAKFYRDAYNHPKVVKLHSITQKEGRGIPSFVLKEERRNCREHEKVRGTVVVAELTGNPN